MAKRSKLKKWMFGEDYLEWELDVFWSQMGIPLFLMGLFALVVGFIAWRVF